MNESPPDVAPPGLGPICSLYSWGLRPRLIHVAAPRLGLRYAIAFATFLLFIALANSSTAEDFVYLKPTETNRAPTRITGTITEFTGKELLIRAASGRESMIPAHRVDDFTTEYTAKQTTADVLFLEKRYAEALPLYKQAAQEEKRTWVRRQLLAQMVWCLRYQNDWEQAAAIFLLIVQSDPTTQFFDAMPLAWRPMTPSLAMERKAAEWIRDDRDPAAQLIGASWLLSSSVENRTDATRTLEELTRAKDIRIAQLAEAQLWRSQVVTARAAEVPRWQAAIEQMPQSLRGGPYHLLGQLLARHGRQTEAALAMMRVPILFPREETLTAESLLAAATALEKDGRTDEARSVLRELIAEHPTSQAAAAAKTKLTPSQ